MPQHLIYLTRKEVHKAISMPEAIHAMETAFKALSSENAVVPQRLRMEMPKSESRALFMPAYLPETQRYSLKVVSICPQNPQKNLPYIQAHVLLFDAKSGLPLAFMDGEAVTAIRTGAATGLATQYLAPPEAKVAALFGIGGQAQTQLEAICAVRPIERIYVRGQDFDRSLAFAERMKKVLKREVKPLLNLVQLQDADIICTATNASQPLFEIQNLKKGTHINAIGSYMPSMCELPMELMQRAYLVADQKAACLKEAGEFIQAGITKSKQIHAELGEVLTGKGARTRNKFDFTVFKSVGNAIQDLALAEKILENASKDILGKMLLLG